MEALSLGQILALFAIALAVIFPGIGSAKSVGRAGEAAAGLIAEDPSSFGQVLVLQALPGTQGIYGFLIGFIIMLRINLLSGIVNMSTTHGLLMVLGALPVTVVCFLSAFYQGRTAMAGISLAGKRPEETGKAITFTVMVETYAVLSFLASFLAVFFLPVG